MRRIAARPGPTSARARSRRTSRRPSRRSKIILLDANADVTSKGALFKKAWAELYPGMIDYRPNSKARRRRLARQDREARVRRREGRRAQRPAADEGGRGRGAVHHGEQALVRGRLAHVRVEGGARACTCWATRCRSRPLDAQVRHHGQRPRQGLRRRGRGRSLNGESPNPSPTLAQHLLQHGVGASIAIHVASVHKYDEKDRTMKAVPGRRRRLARR